MCSVLIENVLGSTVSPEKKIDELKSDIKIIKNMEDHIKNNPMYSGEEEVNVEIGLLSSRFGDLLEECRVAISDLECENYKKIEKVLEVNCDSKVKRCHH